MVLVDVRIQDVSAADESAARETRLNRSLDRATQGVAVTNHADLTPGETTRPLAHLAATGEAGFTHDAAIRQAPLVDAATDQCPLIDHDRALARIRSLPAYGGMDSLRVRGLSATARSRLGLPLPCLSFTRGAPLLVHLTRLFASGIDPGNACEARKGDHSEGHIGPAIPSPHNATPVVADPNGAALEGCSE
jgi:hypothetical protein